MHVLVKAVHENVEEVSLDSLELLRVGREFSYGPELWKEEAGVALLDVLRRRGVGVEFGVGNTVGSS